MVILTYLYWLIVFTYSYQSHKNYILATLFRPFNEMFEWKFLFGFELCYKEGNFDLEIVKCKYPVKKRMTCTCHSEVAQQFHTEQLHFLQIRSNHNIDSSTDGMILFVHSKHCSRSHQWACLRYYHALFGEGLNQWSSSHTLHFFQKSEDAFPE